MKFEERYVLQQANHTMLKNVSLNENCCELGHQEPDPSSLCFRSMPDVFQLEFSACIPARESLNKSISYCFSSPESSLASSSSSLPVKEGTPCTSGDKKKNESESPYYCMKPSMESLLQIKRKEYSHEASEIQRKYNDFLFVGNPAQVYEDVIINNYIPR